MGKLEAHFIFYVKTLKKWLTLCCTYDTIYSEQRKQPKHSEEDKNYEINKRKEYESIKNSSK